MIKKEIEIFSVDEKMPESGKYILFFWENSHGNSRTSFGFYVEKFNLEVEDEEIDYADYNEETDNYYIQKGWYEAGWELEQITNIENVTHWALIKGLEVE